MKPILFNTEMVKAILGGRKTTTRRVIKPQPEPFGKALAYKGGIYAAPKAMAMDAPYRSGDILYVRETFCKLWKLDSNDQIIEGTENYYYAVDGYNPTPFNCFPNEYGFYGDRDCPKWHPSSHMPKEAARIFLRVTDVKVTHLKNITEEGIRKEGHPFSKITGDIHNDFAILWNSTVKKSDIGKYGWNANPWVWVISFERCKEEGTI